ncbi:hypothetical protein [Emticicia agri]|uniref:Uncharacterized protein n=1 Tax=Emticicia agri TaxID=2492393 RepID=A0A4Q5LWA6_9BACT|nr:hypothetical protein [Emticicia agri]RYU94051.1 hypothetical protein EWM59_18955 [Emticicia agri]
MQNQKDNQRRDEDKNTSTQQAGNRNTSQQAQQSGSQTQQGQEHWNKGQRQGDNHESQQNITNLGQDYQTTDATSTQDDTSNNRNPKTHKSEG